MTSQKKSHKAPKFEPNSEYPDPQIKHLAVKINGWAMIDGLDGRETNQTITARAPISTLYSTVITNNKGKDDMLFRSSLEFTETELLPPTKDNRRYLVVGYALRQESQGTYLKKNKGYFMRKSKSRGDSNPSNVLGWDHRGPPIWVVTDVPAKEGEGLTFWALLWPRNGLCTPFTIKIENIFFRWEFRSFANTNNRSSVWEKSVLEAAKTMRSGGGVTSNDQLSNRDSGAGLMAPNFESLGSFPMGYQTFGSQKTDRVDRQEEPSSVNDTRKDLPALPDRSFRKSAPSGIELNQLRIKAGSSPNIPRSYQPYNLTHTRSNSDEEPLAPETLKTARELHKIAQASFKAERDRIEAEAKDSMVKENTLNSWQSALNQEKDSFNRGIAFQASKLTVRENHAQIREQHVYKREQHVQARENSVKEKEKEVEKTDQKLRGWEEILVRKGQEFVERENRYRDERAILVADERLLQDRETAMEESQKAFDAKISDAIESLSVVQQTRKRKARSDMGDLGRESKKQRDGTGI